MTAVVPPGRFGSLKITDKCSVSEFMEKPPGDGGYINGGFFVLDRDCLNVIPDSNVALEMGPLQTLALNGELKAFKHHGFWHPMDTMRDKSKLEDLWVSAKAPWKVW